MEGKDAIALLAWDKKKKELLFCLSVWTVKSTEDALRWFRKACEVCRALQALPQPRVSGAEEICLCKAMSCR